MLDVSISYSGISSMALCHGSISRPRAWCSSRMPYLCGNTDPIGFGTLSNSCTYALLWTVFVPFWHILYLKSSLLWMTSWAEPWLMYMWRTTSSIGTWLFRNMVWTRSMFSWIENMDRCLHGSSSVTLLLNMGSHSQTLHSVKYCSYRKLKFYHWFLPLLRLQPTKILSLHVAPLQCKWKVEWPR